MILFKTIFGLSMVILAVAAEAMRRHVDGIKQGIIYGDQTHAPHLHDIQEKEGALGFLESGAAVGAVFVLLSPSWPHLLSALIAAFLVTYSGALYGNYWFQVHINRAFHRPDIDPNEDPKWHSPRQGRDVPKFWYGDRRRYQRLAAVVLGFGGSALHLGLIWFYHG